MKGRGWLAGLAIVCSGALVWFLASPHREGVRSEVGAVAQEVEGEAPSTESLLVPEGERAGEAEATREAVADLPGVSADAADPWLGELAGLRGRIVEEDGSAVSGIGVTLLEVDGVQLLAQEWERLGERPEEIVAGETTTDEEGRFEFAGTRAGAFHGLGIDLGGGRATLRILDTALENGEVQDVGDIVLESLGVFVGRVVDAEGEPVAGARVRVAPIPPEALLVRAYDLRADTLLTMRGEEVVELPRRVGRLIDLLPVPTAHSGADGRFRIDGVPLQEVVGGVDKEGWVGTPIQKIEAVGGEQDLGDIVLSRGRRVAGIVVDGRGEPVAGAEVFAGAPNLFGFALLQPVGTSGADGRFRGGAVHEQGGIVVAARRGASESWTTLSGKDSSAELHVVLPTAVPLTVHVFGPGGAPVTGARIEVSPERSFGDIGPSFLLRRLYGTAQLVARETEPGTLVCEAVAPGKYELIVHASGLVPKALEVEVPETGSELTVELESGHTLRVRAVDGVTNEPVARARVSILERDSELPSVLDVAWTDETGEATLGPLGGRSGGDRPVRTAVLVEHPRFALRVQDISGVPPVLLVPLDSGGDLQGRIHWGGGLPDRGYTVFVVPQDSSWDGLFSPPRFARSGADGTFRVSGLPVGEYDVIVYERFLEGDPTSLFLDGKEPGMLFRGSCVIETGRTTELEIDLTSSGIGPVARVVGRIRMNGRPLEGARVSLRGNGSTSMETGPDGSFDSGEISAVRGVWVEIEAEVDFPSDRSRSANLMSQYLTCEPGEVKRIDLDLEPMELNVTVVGAQSGLPIEGAGVQLREVMQEGGGWSSPGVEVTDASGVARAFAVRPGTYMLRVSAAGRASYSRQLELPVSEDVRVELPAPTPCSGRIVIDAGPAPEVWCFLRLVPKDGEGTDASAQVDLETMTFEVEGASEGRYEARLWIDGEERGSTEVALGPGGATNLELHFP